jgi:hypothetical protein
MRTTTTLISSMARTTTRSRTNTGSKSNSKHTQSLRTTISL